MEEQAAPRAGSWRKPLPPPPGKKAASEDSPKSLAPEEASSTPAPPEEGRTAAEEISPLVKEKESTIPAVPQVELGSSKEAPEQPAAAGGGGRKGEENSDGQSYKARCLWAWEPKNDQELALNPGDIISLLNWDEADWWYGSLDGKTGWIPASYVEYLDESAQPDSASSEIAEDAPRQLSQDELMMRVVNEIVDTEKDYLKNLRVVIEGYKRKMELLDVPREKIYELFANIEEIHAVHLVFYEKLKTRANEAPRRIGKLFVEEKDKFKIYSEYCVNHAKSTAALEEYRKVPHMKAFFEGCRLLIEQDIPLVGFLLTPIQRLCKYPLLIRELIKYVPEDREEHAELQKALETTKEAASYVNDLQRLKENKKLIDDLQTRIEDWEGSDITEQNSELLLESQLSKISKGKAQDRQFFLFDKLLVYCKENPLKKKTYQFKGRIHLELLIAKDVPDNTMHLNRSHLVNAIQLDRFDLVAPKTYIVCCPTPEEKTRWMNAIQNAQSKLQFHIQVPTSPPKDLSKKKGKTGTAKPPSKSKAETVPPSPKSSPAVPPTAPTTSHAVTPPAGAVPLMILATGGGSARLKSRSNSGGGPQFPDQQTQTSPQSGAQAADPRASVISNASVISQIPLKMPRPSPDSGRSLSPSSPSQGSTFSPPKAQPASQQKPEVAAKPEIFPKPELAPKPSIAAKPAVFPPRPDLSIKPELSPKPDHLSSPRPELSPRPSISGKPKMLAVGAPPPPVIAAAAAAVQAESPANEITKSKYGTLSGKAQFDKPQSPTQSQNQTSTQTQAQTSSSQDPVAGSDADFLRRASSVKKGTGWDKFSTLMKGKKAGSVAQSPQPESIPAPQQDSPPAKEQLPPKEGMVAMRSQGFDSLLKEMRSKNEQSPGGGGGSGASLTSPPNSLPSSPRGPKST